MKVTRATAYDMNGRRVAQECRSIIAGRLSADYLKETLGNYSDALKDDLVDNVYSIDDYVEIIKRLEKQTTTEYLEIHGELLVEHF